MTNLTTFIKKSFVYTLIMCICMFFLNTMVFSQISNTSTEDSLLFIKISDKQNKTPAKKIFETAKSFEQKGNFNLAIRTYKLLSEDPALEGSSKSLVSKLSIANIYERIPGLQTAGSNSSVIYENICNSPYLDEEAVKIVKFGCKKCYEKLQDSISVMQADYNENLKQLEKIIETESGLKKQGQSLVLFPMCFHH